MGITKSVFGKEFKDEVVKLAQLETGGASKVVASLKLSEALLSHSSENLDRRDIKTSIGVKGCDERRVRS